MIKEEIKILLEKAKETNELEIINEIITDEIWTEIFKLTNLQMLYIWNGEIKEIPKELFNFKKLLYLNLINNQIKEIPKEIGSLIKLKKLRLDYNQIKEIPTEIERLINLKLLNLTNNMINEIPKEIGKLINLEDFYLDSNLIFEIPKEIGNLFHLRELSLYYNRIKKLPKEIGKLINLQYFKLSNNKIKKLPKEIGDLINLQKLHLQKNQITEIPKEIGNLKYLEILYLWGNKITKLPKEIKEIEKLNILDFTGSPVSIPNGFEITNFKLYKKLKISNLDKNLNIIIGKNGTGKTTLLQAIAFSLINENDKNIDTRTLQRYITKNIKQEESKSHFTLFEKDGRGYDAFVKEELKAIIKANFSENIIKKITINSKLENYFVTNRNLLLAYGSNLFYDESIKIDRIMQELSFHGAEHSYIESLFPDKDYKDYSIKIPNPTDILFELEKYDKLEIKEVSNILLKTLNEFLGIQEVEKFKIERDIGGYFYQNIETKENFDLHELSEGYRSNILLVGDILMRVLSARNLFSNSVSELFDYEKGCFRNVYGTILIDEFDKHLHPTWQRLFVSKLTEVLPNVQFFLTTHNPVALQSAEGYTAIILKKDEKSNIIADIEKIKIGNSLEIINNHFFEGEIFGEKTNIDINKLNELKKLVLINKRKIDLDNFMKQVKELKNKDLSEEFSTLIDYDVSYLKNFIDNVKNK